MQFQFSAHMSVLISLLTCLVLAACGQSDTPTAEPTEQLESVQAAFEISAAPSTSTPVVIQTKRADSVRLSAKRSPIPTPTAADRDAKTNLDRETPQRFETPQDLETRVESAPAPAPVGTVVVYETSVTLLTYPYEEYQTDAFDPILNWPFKRFDRERFLEEDPMPEERTYRALVLENSYLQLTILPELGGRLWQAEHKASGNRMFYQNSVVKPSPWGPTEQLGWLAIGGLEWNLPVIEHGYDWGTPWGFLPNQHSTELASITVFTPREGRAINASVTISLLAGAASFSIEPTISNLGADDLAFDYWQTAMLAPGKKNHPSDDLTIVVPTDQIIVHSTGDPTLPAPQVPFDWPVYAERNLSRLGTWDQYLGFFEYPAANGPFVGVYDPARDAGAVRIFPADVVRGSKVFGLGWNQPLSSDYFTDDDSAYVELHGGLAPSFFEQYFLPAGGSISWREVWYPVQQIDGISVASEIGALYLTRTKDDLYAGYYPTRPMDGMLIVFASGIDGNDSDQALREIARHEISAQPNRPFFGLIASAEELENANRVMIRIEDSVGRQLMEYDE